ncbi:MAG TPA: [Fe-Fe] hydrogenase large subunit C-terminal domain-containing protein [Halanaerobiales bacterium]|nr:[Fe-Fe] hydrogenase large subunit C-terminal domain-containing protein [Halanaerobiales bacterium]
MVVFIGPCISKKLEAEDEHVVDYVITFEELAAIFVAADIELTKIDEEIEINDASKYGRGYATAGGVAEAIKTNIKKKHNEDIKIEKADGLAECKKMLTKAAHSQYDGYLIEGLACPGACVGVPVL